MELKLIEDLQALAEHKSFVRAAQARHVTHPAFGRRIRALEAWAGTALVQRKEPGLPLTPAGLGLLEQAAPLVAALQQQRAAFAAPAGRTAPKGQLLRVATGRTLARTLVADWLARLKAPLKGHRVELRTASMADVAALLARGEVELLCCYEHPALSMGLSPQRFLHTTLAQDRLLPVARADARGQPRFRLETAPLIAYAPSLSLGRLLADHLRNAHPDTPARTQFTCDSADAMHELVAKGLGVAWLPATLVAGDLRRGLLVPLSGRKDEVPFEVRLYRPRARQNAVVEAAWAASV